MVPEPIGAPPPPRQPVFNLPAVLTATIAVLVAVHALRGMLGRSADLWLLFTLGFVPARYDPASDYAGQWPGGAAADWLGFASYALLHGDWVHLGVNALWLIAFGAPVARRLGAARFIGLMAVTAIAGAAVHLATNWGSVVPMVGASGAVSGLMAAAIRFAFAPGGPLTAAGRWRADSHAVPAQPLSVALADRRVVLFIAVWIGLNLLFGAGAAPVPGADGAVAWQAHLGGFFAGLLLFPLFDRPRRTGEDQNSGSWT